MKKAIYLLIFFSFLAVLKGQPDLTSNSIPQVGEKYTIIDCDTTGITEGESGASKVWDFSKILILPGDEARSYNSIISAPSGIKSEFFQEADYALRSEGGDTYFKTNSNRIERLGVGFESGQEVLNNTEIYYSLPFAFQSDFNDLFSGQIKTNADGIDVTVNRGGMSKAYVDSYGTLILPDGTFQNVLRVRIDQTIYDTIPPSVSGAPQIINITETTNYLWMNDQYKFGLLNISYVKSSQIMFGTVINTTNTKNIWILDEMPEVQDYLTIPSITKPINNSEGLELPLTIEWTESELIKSGSIRNEILQNISYDLQVTTDPNFTAENLIFNYEVATGTSFVFNENINSIYLYMRVNAKSGDLQSGWSEIVSVQLTEQDNYLTTPEFTSPENGAELTELPVVLEWSQSQIMPEGTSDNIEYVVELSIEPTFSNPETIEEVEVGNQTSLEIDYNLPTFTYYARVKAVSGELTSPWSEVLSFDFISNTETPETPTLLSPENGAVDLEYESLTFVWESDEVGVIFQFKVWNDMESLELYVGEDKFFEAENILQPNTTYFWSVRADRDFSDTSDWAEPWTFTTKNPASVKDSEFNSPNLTLLPNPAIDAVNISFTLETQDKVGLRIVSLDGSTLYNSSLGTLNAGQHNNNIDISGFAAGAYYVILEGSKVKYIKSIIKQ
ncbi:MAG: T9SS type A sorting domain-containing protein [Candidatus Kapabacteria bacterium]|nr:T9SS type A sorting domain-containing protein [Ignavibacteriota bacterium]MCW5883452.1 T9SS type A sorting domain-containing protein [Candidatus Kapabacteria bacterium]